MSEIVRSVIAYFSDVVGSRSCAQRRNTRLPLSVSLADEGGAGTTDTRSPACTGLTRDISATELSFTLPSMCIGDRHIFREVLRVRVALPDGWITFRAAPTRYDFLEGGGYNEAYLVGVRIVDMDADSKCRLNEYLRAPKRPTVGDDARRKARERASAYGA